MKIIIQHAIESHILKKIVLSRPSDKSIIKTSAALFEKNGQDFMQFETLHTDGKATHVNVTAAEAPAAAERIFTDGYGQADIITSGG